MSDKPDYPKFITPRGTFQYPHLVTPDTKFDSDGVFRCTTAVGVKEAAAFVAHLEAIRDTFYDELEPKQRKVARKADVVEIELDDTGEETGRVLIKAKQKAKITTKKGQVIDKKVPLFDSVNKRISPKSVWSGTEGRLAGVLIPYFMASTKEVGVSLRLNGVQILKLVEGSGDSGESYGFEEEEGYEGETFENNADNAGGDDTDGDAGEF